MSEPGALDAILSQLWSVKDGLERFAVLQQLISFWDGTPTTQAYELPKIAVPLILQRWYEWAGPGSSLLSRHNNLYNDDPQRPYWRLELQDGLLAFQSENQGCFFWATEAEGEDPPVYGRENAEQPWQPQGIRLSEHLVASYIFETLTDAPQSGFVDWVEDATLRGIAERVPPLPLPPWHWPTNFTQFYGGSDTLMMVCRGTHGDGGSLYVAGLTPEALTPLANHPALDWSHRTF